jgi:hypothetical protein
LRQAALAEGVTAFTTDNNKLMPASFGQTVTGTLVALPFI